MKQENKNDIKTQLLDVFALLDKQSQLLLLSKAEGMAIMKQELSKEQSVSDKEKER